MRTFISSASVSALVAMFVSAPGHAQTANAEADTGGNLQEIIVTAQRRAQNLQRVPIAVNSIGGDALKTGGSTAFTDIGTMAPSVIITRSAYTVSPFIRGIGNSVPGPGNDPSVAVYVDGVYQASPTGLLFSFNNIDRVEVLKGPQGTLFGRNATGGLIHVISKDPQEEFNIKAGIGYGNFDTVSGDFYVTGGAGHISFDLAATYSKQFDGWGTNLFTPAQAGTVLVNGVAVPVPGVDQDVGVNQDLGLRARVKYEISDTLTARLSGIYTHNQGDQGVYRRALPGQINVVNGNTFVVGGGFYDINSDVNWGVNSRTYQAALDLSLDLDFATLKSISAYYDNHFVSSIPSENTPFVSQTNVTVQQYSRQKTQELQLTSNKGSPFEWVLGSLYLDSKSGNDPTLYTRGNIEPSFVQYGYQATKSISGFGQATIPVFGDATHVTLGARYTRDKIAATAFNLGTRTSTGAPPTFVAGVISNFVPLNSDVQNSFTYRVGADHRLSDDVMIYTSLSTGFKSGTYNVASLCLRAGIPNCLTPPVPVKPEKLTAYEVGFKSEFADRTVRINGSAFYYDYKDLQVQTITGTPSVQLIQNAAAAELYGAELELVYAPTRRLRLSGQASYLHTKYKDFVNAVTAVRGPAPTYNGVNITIPNAKGNQLNRAPKLTTSISADYRLPLGRDELGFNATYYYNDGFFWEVGNRLRQSSYNIVNTQLEWVPAGDQFAVQLWTKNLLNEKYYIFQQGSGNGDQGVPAGPRTYGISVNFKLRPEK